MLNFNRLKKKLVIAEIGQSHKSSMIIAKNLIDKVAKTGADIVKFQTHYAEAESTLDDKFRGGFKFKHKTRFSYWKDHEFTARQWKVLKSYANKKKLIFTSSPFSLKAFNILKSININLWKIGSGEFFSEDLIKMILKKRDPIIISTGLANWNEIKKIVQLLKKKKANFLIMQCTSKYPLSLKEVGINNIYKIKKKFNCPVGLSDHSGTIYPALLSISDNQTQIIEVHVSAKKTDNYNPDKSSSISFDELKFICNYRDKVQILKKNMVNKDKIAKKLKKYKILFTKSLTLKENLKKGSKIRKKDLCLKKPGNGISNTMLNKVVGKVLKSDVSKYRLLKWSDFEK